MSERDVAAFLQQLMKERNISQVQLAKEIGRSRGTVQQILNGSMRTASDDTIMQLSRVFGVNPDTWYGLYGVTPPDIREFLRDHPRLWNTIRVVMARFLAAQREDREKEAEYKKRVAAVFTGTPSEPVEFLVPAGTPIPKPPRLPGAPRDEDS